MTSFFSRGLMRRFEDIILIAKGRRRKLSFRFVKFIISIESKNRRLFLNDFVYRLKYSFDFRIKKKKSEYRFYIHRERYAKYSA